MRKGALGLCGRRGGHDWFAGAVETGGQVVGGGTSGGVDNSHPADDLDDPRELQKIACTAASQNTLLSKLMPCLGRTANTALVIPGLGEPLCNFHSVVGSFKDG